MASSAAVIKVLLDAHVASSTNIDKLAYLSSVVDLSHKVTGSWVAPGLFQEGRKFGTEVRIHGNRELDRRREGLQRGLVIRGPLERRQRAATWSDIREARAYQIDCTAHQGPRAAPNLFADRCKRGRHHCGGCHS